MGQEELLALEKIFESQIKKMEESYTVLLKFAYGLVAAILAGLLLYFISFGEVRANSTTARDGVIRLEQEMQKKANESEFSLLKNDVTDIKASTSRIEGALEEHLRNDKR